MRMLREGEKEMRKQCEKFGKSHKEVYWYFASKSSAYDMPMFPAKNLKVSNKIPPSDSYWNTELLDGIFYFYVYMYSNYVQ